MSLFSELNLLPEVERAVALMGFTETTPIQAQAIPVIRSGADLVAQSQTGTGKTVAFGIPAIEAVDTTDVKSGIQVLIVCPTRELAMQAAEQIRNLARFLPEIRPAEVYGGAAIDKQCIRLRRANMVIGTPGRIMDHMRRKTIKLSALKMIVLDEADEMLNMGFKEDIETILTGCPEEHQTVLFSATMPPAILAITTQFQKDPQHIAIDKAHVTLDNISQTYVDVPHSAKQNALDLIMQYYHPRCAIVFCNTKSMADELAAHLSDTGVKAEALHGDLKQAQRTAVMQGFKSGRTAVLVATDIAARGIDVSGVEYVINYDIPQNTEYYVHRIGRTGRAGKSGVSITICGSRREVLQMRQTAQAVKSEIAEVIVPTVNDIEQKGSRKVLDKLTDTLQQPVDARYAEMVRTLMDSGLSAQDIAAAALQMLAAEHAPATAHLKDMPPVRKNNSDHPRGERGPHTPGARKPRPQRDFVTKPFRPGKFAAKKGRKPQK